MSRFEKEVTDFYKKHKKAADTLDEDNSLINATSNDLAIHRFVYKGTNDLPTHLQPDVYEKGLSKHYKHRDIAQKKYDDNLNAAAKHKDKHFDRYVSDARSEIVARQAGEVAVVQAAEDILRTPEENELANPLSDTPHS